MLQEVGELTVDLLLPSPGPDLDRLFDKKGPNVLRVPLAEPGAFKRRVNQSGWFDEEVIAGGLLTQGKPQSLLSMITGWALVEMVRGRRSKSLPREFCVVVTASRVVVLAMSPWSEGSGADVATDVVVKVRREEVSSWSRGSVRIDLDHRNLKSRVKGGTLDLAGVEQFPVNWGSGSDTEEVVALVGRG
jgi:hypothetical protein